MLYHLYFLLLIQQFCFYNFFCCFFPHSLSVLCVCVCVCVYSTKAFSFYFFHIFTSSFVFLYTLLLIIFIFFNGFNILLIFSISKLLSFSMIFFPSYHFFIPQFSLQLLVFHNYLFNFPQISHLSLILYFYIFSHITLFFYKITITNIFHFYCNSSLI